MNQSFTSYLKMGAYSGILGLSIGAQALKPKSVLIVNGVEGRLLNESSFDSSRFEIEISPECWASLPECERYFGNTFQPFQVLIDKEGFYTIPDISSKTEQANFKFHVRLKLKEVASKSTANKSSENSLAMFQNFLTYSPQGEDSNKMVHGASDSFAQKKLRMRESGSYADFSRELSLLTVVYFEGLREQDVQNQIQFQSKTDFLTWKQKNANELQTFFKVSVVDPLEEGTALGFQSDTAFSGTEPSLFVFRGGPSSRQLKMNLSFRFCSLAYNFCQQRDEGLPFQSKIPSTLFQILVPDNDLPSADRTLRGSFKGLVKIQSNDVGEFTSDLVLQDLHCAGGKVEGELMESGVRTAIHGTCDQETAELDFSLYSPKTKQSFPVKMLVNRIAYRRSGMPETNSYKALAYIEPARLQKNPHPYLYKMFFAQKHNLGSVKFLHGNTNKSIGLGLGFESI